MNYHQAVKDFERRLLKQALEDNNNNQAQAAKAVGLSRSTFIDKCSRLNPLKETDIVELSLDIPKLSGTALRIEIIKAERTLNALLELERLQEENADLKADLAA